jgi:hypothetical protein
MQLHHIHRHTTHKVQRYLVGDEGLIVLESKVDAVGLDARLLQLRGELQKEEDVVERHHLAENGFALCQEREKRICET